MSHACHRFWTCYQTFTFFSLMKRCTIPCACHAKRHLNLQKWSETLVFCTFWLGNVLRATTAFTFSTSQLPKVFRYPGVLYLFTWKCASCQNGVQFFIPAALASLLFDPPEPQIIGETQCFATFLPFLSSDSFSSTLLSSNLSLLSASALLCFPSVHIVGSLTSKPPSIKKDKAPPEKIGSEEKLFTIEAHPPFTKYSMIFEKKTQ